MTVLEWQADIIEKAAQRLAFWVTTTPEDKLQWCPTVDENSCARCIIDQIDECIRVNKGFAALLRGETAPPRPAPGAAPSMSGEEAATLLEASGKELGAA